jgi:hypothetical protein
VVPGLVVVIVLILVSAGWCGTPVVVGAAETGTGRLKVAARVMWRFPDLTGITMIRMGVIGSTTYAIWWTETSGYRVPVAIKTRGSESLTRPEAPLAGGGPLKDPTRRVSL